MKITSTSNAQCINTVDREARYSAQCIISTSVLLDLKTVLLGYIASRPDLLLDRICRAFQGVCITRSIPGLKIIMETLGKDLSGFFSFWVSDFCETANVVSDILCNR